METAFMPHWYAANKKRSRTKDNYELSANLYGILVSLRPCYPDSFLV